MICRAVLACMTVFMNTCSGQLSMLLCVKYKLNAFQNIKRLLPLLNPRHRSYSSPPSSVLTLKAQQPYHEEHTLWKTAIQASNLLPLSTP